MKIYGDFTEKEAKLLTTLGCRTSLKDLVGSKFRIIGCIESEIIRKSSDGEEYKTNYLKIADDELQTVSTVKYTQTVITDQAISIIENDLTEIVVSVDYSESNSGNRYLSISI